LECERKYFVAQAKCCGGVKRETRPAGGDAGREEEMDIVIGRMYLFVERVPLKTHILLRKELAKGRRVLYITKNAPEMLRPQLGEEMEHVEVRWLTPRLGDGCLSPISLDALEESIAQFMEGNPDGIIVLNGLEVLEMWNGFSPVAACLRKAHAKLAENNNSLMVSVDPKNLWTASIAPLAKFSDEVIGSTT
jgi:hypothetical protein